MQLRAPERPRRSIAHPRDGATGGISRRRSAGVKGNRFSFGGGGGGPLGTGNWPQRDWPSGEQPFASEGVGGG